MKWAFFIISLLTALAQVLKSVELGPLSVRGRFYSLLFIVFTLQAIYSISEYDVLLLISRILVSIGILQYVSPYIIPGLKTFPYTKWIGWSLLSLVFLLIPMILLLRFGAFSMVHFIIVLADALTVISGLWVPFAFAGSEVGKRWIAGSIVIFLLIIVDTVLFIHKSSGYILLSIMSIIMALIALRQG